MLKVCKFGGTSLADAAQFQKVKKIVEADDSRRVIVVSALGKRHPNDQKITDLLYLLHAHLKADAACFSIFEQIRYRYLQIEKQLNLSCNIDTVSTAIYAKLSKNTPSDYLVSRGEYLAAKLMAAYLGFTFVDSTRWLFFDQNGNVDEARSSEKLKALANAGPIVTPGFYGISDEGEIRLFSRGGSDITGALAARFLEAEEYENWTDVNGLLTADPRVVLNPETVKSISYEALLALSCAELQVLHKSCIPLLQDRSILLSIRNTNDPDGAFTSVRTDAKVSVPLVIAQKTICADTALIVCLITDSEARHMLSAGIENKNPVFWTQTPQCIYILCKKEAQNAFVSFLYGSIYEKGSLK